MVHKALFWDIMLHHM